MNAQVLCIKWCRTMHTVSLPPLQTPNFRLKTIQEFIGGEKPTYKWTHAVQAHVVQGSAVLMHATT